MKKHLLSVFKTETSLTFAIKREMLNSGKERLTPVVKLNGLFQQWTPIVCINGTYEAIDIPHSFEYTEKDCMVYIDAYRDRMEKEKAHLINKTTYQEII